MVLNSDGMSCSVGEEFPVSLFCNITAAGVVHITHSGAWPGGIDSSLLGFPDNLIDFSGFFRNFTEKDGSRHIRAVVVPDTADVQHNTVSPLSKGGIRGVVRICAGFSVSGDRRKRHIRMTGDGIQLPDFLIQFFFCKTFAGQRDQLFHNLIIGKGGFPHQLLFLCILDPPHIIDDCRTVEVGGCPVQFLEAQKKSGGPGFINAQRLVLFCIPAEEFHCVLGIVVPHQFHAQILLLGKQTVEDQFMTAVDIQIKRQHTLSGMNPFSGEIKNSCWIGDDHLRKMLFLHSRQNTCYF